MKFANRMDRFGEGVFSMLAQMKKKKLEEGEMIVDLSIGAPNIAPAPHILKALSEACLVPENYLYAIQDQQALLEAVSDWYARRYGVELNPETEICSLLGSQEGLAHIALSIVDEGDVVLVPDPCYPVFADGPSLAGAELYYMPQREENHYIIDLKEIPEEVAQKAKFMIVSYPNNPTAVLAPDCFYEELIAFAKKYDVVLLHDNAYSDIVFGGKKGKSFLSYPGAMEVGIEFYSLSKSYNMTGMRISFALGNREIINMFKKVRSQIDYGIFLPIQKAAVAALTGPQESVWEQCAEYERRNYALCRGLTKIGWEVPDGQGTMFVWAPIPKNYQSSEKFVIDLMKKAGMIVTPGTAFGNLGEGYVRIALVYPVEMIEKAIKAVADSGILKD